MNSQKYLKEFFPKSVLMKAIQDYKKIAVFTLEETAKEYICTIKRSVYNTELVFNEFGNYLIDLANSSRSNND